MRSIVEITLYPLDKDYETPILEFLARLRRHSELDITTGPTSTVVHGDYEQVMDVLRDEMRTSLSGTVRMSFVLKVLNTEGHSVTN